MNNNQGKMMKYFIFIMFFGAVTLLHCHDKSMLGGLTAGTDVFVNYEGVGIAPDMNLTLWLFNTGASINYQNRHEVRYKLYAGVGFLNLFQFQYGTNFTDRLIRFRTILAIFNSFPVWEGLRYESVPWYKRINLQLHYERNLDNEDFNNFAIGLSYLL